MKPTLLILLSVVVWQSCKRSSHHPTSSDLEPAKNNQQKALNHDPIRLTRSEFKSKMEPPYAQVAHLENSIDSICTEYLNQSKVKAISVQFIDLRSRLEFTIHPEKRYIPASLLKIPVLIAGFKLEEIRAGSLNDVLVLSNHNDENFNINLEENKGYGYPSGEKYNLQNLLRIMAGYSDNRATISIMNYLDAVAPNFIEKVEADLDASIPSGIDNNSEFIQIGHFAPMLDALFSCTYLSQEHSKAALRMLSASSYSQGFRFSIPKQIPIAHKFGVRFNVTEMNPEFPIQLHEVGIIYHPTHPFILSVMTKGSSIEPLRAALREIAKTCYGMAESLPEE